MIGHRLAFDGKTFTITGAEGTPAHAGTYATDPSVQPARIDFTVGTAQGEAAAWEGIYRVEGDRLVIVDDAPDPAKGRPTAFAAAAGSGHILVQLHRMPRAFPARPEMLSFRFA